jgi:hypothetical protein
MELHQFVRTEWHDYHWLSRQTLGWIRDHADRDDPRPITTALAQLRLGES